MALISSLAVCLLDFLKPLGAFHTKNSMITDFKISSAIPRVKIFVPDKFLAVLFA